MIGAFCYDTLNAIANFLARVWGPISRWTTRNPFFTGLLIGLLIGVLLFIVIMGTSPPTGVPTSNDTPDGQQTVQMVIQPPAMTMLRLGE